MRLHPRWLFAAALETALLFGMFGGPAGAQSPAPMPVVITPTMTWNRDEAIGKRGRSGYTFDTVVNGVPLQMVFDTGASHITLRAEDAARIGIDMHDLTYSGLSRTANGTAEVAPVTIASLTVGNITRQNVAALVARPGKLDVDLLGQSFLTRTAGYRLEGNQLILTGGRLAD